MVQYKGITGDFKGTPKNKKNVNVEINVSGEITNQERSQESVGEIVKQYPDMLITNPKMELQSHKISFEVASPIDETLNPDDVKSKVTEYLTMYQFPFKVQNVEVNEGS
jgi:hypothetical protein